MAGGLSAEQDAGLPALRHGLTFVEGPVGPDGSGSFQLRDPLQHRYFRISQDTRNILSLWQAGKPVGQLVSEAATTFGISLTAEKLSDLIGFLTNANLFDVTDTHDCGDLEARRNRLRMTPGTLFPRLTFFKLPLMQPEPLLRWLSPFTDLLFTKAFAFLVALTVFSGLYLSFFDMIAAVSSPWSTAGIGLGGIVQIGIALVLLKACHELGHAISAHRYGCRVPTLGIAFMAFIPLFYTDVTDAWRLSSKRQRVLISAAGMAAEIILAGGATLLWAFLPDGPAREIVFYVATVGWISSLAFNLNPLAKFDGYYILCDLLGMENLQSRSFALARWKLRQVLLVNDLDPPEKLGSRLAGWLIAYAGMVMVYRLVVFMGISLLFYTHAAKVLGIVLVGLTVLQFVLLPVWRELRVWRALAARPGSRVSFNRPLLIAGVMLLIFVLPVQGTVRVPAVLVAGELQKIYPPQDALIADIHVNQDDRVEFGAPVVRFAIPELEAEAEKVEIELDAARKQLARAVSNRTDRSHLAVLRNDVTALERRREDLRQEIAELDVTSRLDGDVVQVSRQFREGGWVSKNNWVAMIRSGSVVISRGYVGEADLDRITTGSTGRFIPDDVTRGAVSLRVRRISGDAAVEIDLRELSTAHGGAVATLADQGSGLTPVHPVFPIELEVAGEVAPPNQIVRGTVLVNGRRQSLAASVWRQVAHVFIREASF